MLSWDAALKFTNIKLELLTDYDKYLFLEKAIRGGISTASIHYARANNKYLENFNTAKPSSYICYWDCNSLYSTAMCESLPVRDFRWLKPSEINSLLFTDISDNSSTCYILEVDLVYPPELHESHTEYPLCPSHMDINFDILSPFQQELLNKQGKYTYKNKKLVGTLLDKTKYVIHYRMLKLCLELGLQLTKIHKVLAFTQEKWLEPYINFNINQRKSATNDFYKDLYKLFNNSVYGKTMENVRNRINVEIITDEIKCKKRLKKPNVDDYNILATNLATFLMN